MCQGMSPAHILPHSSLPLLTEAVNNIDTVLEISDQHHPVPCSSCVQAQIAHLDILLL